jgi:hypothetical protein
MSGSVTFIPLPTVVNSASLPGIIVTDLTSVAEETRQYFTGLYKRSAPPNKPKPWLTTPSVLTVKDHRSRINLELHKQIIDEVKIGL